VSGRISAALAAGRTLARATERNCVAPRVARGVL